VVLWATPRGWDARDERMKGDRQQTDKPLRG
jgi:hypothetical protein